MVDRVQREKVLWTRLDTIAASGATILGYDWQLMRIHVDRIEITRPFTIG